LEDPLVAELAAFVDIHCHLVPGIDDGAQSWDEALAMARMAVADGIGTIVATPHQLGNYRHNQPAEIRARTSQLQALLDEHRVGLRVFAGADVRIEAGLAAQAARGEVLTLADRRRHILLELPHDVYFPLDRLLVELSAVGIVGILSHPERNSAILARPSVVRPLVAAGCLMQVTAGSLLGAFGPACRKLSERLVEEGLVHFVSSDAHGARARRPMLRGAFDRVAELAGPETALDLCCRNPAAVASGRDVTAARRPANSRGWRGFFARKRAA
jgi:protein-tyrosine phosphatase